MFHAQFNNDVPKKIVHDFTAAVKYIVLSIGNLRISSPLVLAPMAGITDLPFRLLNRSFGCDLAFTEMISANSLIYGSKQTKKMLFTTQEDGPLGIQLLGRDPEALKIALDLIGPDNYDIIDFNAACPVKKVISRGEGSALLKQPDLLEKILKTLISAAAAPVTVKIRSGWDDSSVNARDVAMCAQDAGAQGIFIHGRTKAQGYSGTVDYRTIAAVKKAVRIPVIASGDALTPHLIQKMLHETGCDGIAIARGALGNPWIFPQTREFLSGNTSPLPAISDIIAIMKQHLDANIDFYGEQTGVILFRKFFAWYTRGYSLKHLKTGAFQASTREHMRKLMDTISPLSLPVFLPS